MKITELEENKIYTCKDFPDNEYRISKTCLLYRRKNTDMWQYVNLALTTMLKMSFDIVEPTKEITLYELSYRAKGGNCLNTVFVESVEKFLKEVRCHESYFDILSLDKTIWKKFKLLG